MNRFDSFKSKNIDELVELLDECGVFDEAPWIKWFDENNCKKCETVPFEDQEWGWCELNGKCKFYQDINNIPNNKDIIKMWLESEI